MLIQQMSDLHLEFDPSFRAENTDNADILMLNGDICVADYFRRGADSSHFNTAFKFFQFFSDAAKKYKRVIYIAGNHEHYRGKISRSIRVLKEKLACFENVHVLDNEFLDVDDTRFIGTTLWTDCNKGNPLSIMSIEQSMNDFRLIKKDAGKFTARASIALHVEAKNFLKEAAKNHSKVVVMSHHAPSFGSVHPQYRTGAYGELNGAYYSDLDKLILNRPQIKLWTHGHMHNTFDYLIGDTKIVCNPKGYRDENPSFNPNLLLEI